jgi:prepilin signal peptidase PulO-like enzyme (type II secretory pathway)
MYVSILFGVLGTILGSFICVLAERIHTGQSFVKGKSRCNSCNRELRSIDLVPVLTWVIARGRCLRCKSKIPFTYLLIELTLGLAFAFSYLHFGPTTSLLIFLLALCIATFVVVYDLRHTVVPVYASMSLAIVSLLFSGVTLGTGPLLGSALILAGCIALFFTALHIGSKGRAMGLGDAPIAFSLALLTFPYSLTGLVVSFWVGALYGVTVLLARRRGPTMGIEVPFVPFLVIGHLLAFFFSWNLFSIVS